MLSNTARVAFAKQAAKATPATVGFHTMFATVSASAPEYEYVENENYHPGIHARASTQNAAPVRIAYRIPVSCTFWMHPNGIVPMLIGMGFLDTPSDQTTYTRHTMVKADVDDALYLSMLHRIGEGTGAFERKISAVRGTQLTISAARNQLQCAFTGMGLSEATSVGTETITAEDVEPLLPTKGSLTWGALALGTPREHNITIARPVDEEDHLLHAFGRNDSPETGFSISGEMRGLDLSFDFYKKLVWGGTSGTGASEAIVTDSLTIIYFSANNISGAAVPFKFSLALTKVEARIGNFQASGNNIIRADVSWRMIDDSASAPATILVENDVASY